MTASFTPDGERLAVGDQNGSVAFWKVDQGQPILAEKLQHTSEVTELHFSEDGRRLLAGLSAGFKVWERPSQESNWRSR